METATTTTAAAKTVARLFRHPVGKAEVEVRYTFNPKMGRPHIVVERRGCEYPEVYRYGYVTTARKMWAILTARLAREGFTKVRDY